MDLQKLPALTRNSESDNKKFFSKLKMSQSNNLDNVVQQIHEEVFQDIDCLMCANCCKTTSPVFYQKDIERLAKHFKIRPSLFIEKYLHLDDEDDYVLNVAPCPFLGQDNYCSVYDYRPLACKEYPHTNRKRFHQLLNLTLKNIPICPAVYEIVEKLKVKFKNL